MARCSHLVIFYFKEKFFVSNVSASVFPKRSEDLVEKIISPECREISLELTQIAAKYRCRSNNRTREILLKKKTANFCVQTILPK